MDRKEIFKYSAFVLFLVFVLSFIANKFYLYYSVWYFDMIMHFLGGVWLGLLAFYLFTREALPTHPVLKMLFFVLVLGFGWEVFEFLFYNYIADNPFGFIDSVSDLMFDLFGGLCAILYLCKIQSK